MKPQRIFLVSTLAAAFAVPLSSAQAGAPQAALPSQDSASSFISGSTVGKADNIYGMTPAEGRLVFANSDGTVSRSQFLTAMERRWDLMEKDSNGELAAAGAGMQGNTYGPKMHESESPWHDQPEHILNQRGPTG